MIAALIPCRTGSKGIPGKNFKDFCGKPLWRWTFDAAVESGVFDKIILSSDGGFPGMVEGAEVDNERPAEMADDVASLDTLLWYYAQKYPEYDEWCLLQPTSPLRAGQDIIDAYAMFSEKCEDDDWRYESLVSAYHHPVMAWIKDAVGVPGEDTPQPIATYHYISRPNRQQRTSWFLENGAIYFTRRYVLEWFQTRLHGTIALFEMPYERSFEIDEPIDWFLCEKLMERRTDGVA